MQIFIDTNIFHNHWQLKNVDFSFLFNFIRNTESKLLISEVVVVENENNRNKELLSQRSVIEKALKTINIISKDPVDIDFKNLAKEYKFKEVLEEKLDKDFIDYIDVTDIPQKETLKRALENRPPFKIKEKGYRDTLIWLSLLYHLKKNGIKEEVAFISANSDDFYNGQKTGLKKELQEDLDNLGMECKIKVYNSLFLFIEKNVMDDDIFDENELDQVEGQIEDCTINFINEYTIDQLRNSLAGRLNVLSNLLTIKSHEFEIAEGMEDAGIVKANRTNGPKIYIIYEYNFRIVEFRINLSKEEFEANYEKLRTLGNYEELEDGDIQIEIYPRLFFKSSFEYDARTKVVDGLVVNALAYKL